MVVSVNGPPEVATSVSFNLTFSDDNFCNHVVLSSTNSLLQGCLALSKVEYYDSTSQQ